MNAVQALCTEASSRFSELRAELCTAFVDGLNRAGITYCLLSGFESYPNPGDGDLDFMVLPRDSAKLAPILGAVTRGSRALLVQAIQHETDAWYLVLAKQTRDEVGYFDADCTTDYRRNGRLWLRAEHVLARRRRSGGFYVAAKPDEFLYYLIKKVLKQEITREHLRRLRELYAAAPEECCEGMRRFWRTDTVRMMTGGILRSDDHGMRLLAGRLLAELEESAQVENWAGRCAQQTAELRRRWWRVVNPTGLSVRVWGGREPERNQLAAAMVDSLRPAFRRTLLTRDARTSDELSEWLARVRSTLVLKTSEPRPKGPLRRTMDVCEVNVTEHDVESATRLVLEQMARRIQKRGRVGA